MSTDAGDSGPSLDNRFWKLFSRVLNRSVTPGEYSRETLPEWDSLRHVELIFELEEAFGINIDPNDIVDLYSTPQTIIAYLRREVSK